MLVWCDAPIPVPARPGIKDLDRNYLPWTRYPEEREQLVISGLIDGSDDKLERDFPGL
jgi:hypothetical protein